MIPYSLRYFKQFDFRVEVSYHGAILPQGDGFKPSRKEFPMDFKQHMLTAWNLTLGHIGPLILITIAVAAVSFVTLGILAPVTMAAYIHSLLLLLREGREPRIQDIFSEMRLFFPLLLFGIVAFLASMLGFMLLVIPGILVSLALAFFCLYMLPLMTDRRMGLVEALKESYALSLRGNLGDQIVVVILFLGISAVGGSVFVGFLFTQPLATLFLVSVYEEKVRTMDSTARGE
jgi:hypothetical protein